MTHDYFGDFDDLFERMNRGRWIAPGGRYGSPDDDFAIDVAYDDDEIVVTADVPGFEKEDLDVSVDDGVLTIRAESDADVQREAESAEEESYVRRERRHRSMRRTITLPADVDAEGASAAYRNGVLTIRLPVVGESDVSHIDVDAE